MKKLLIVEGNLSEENNKFSAEGIQTHTESLKDSLNYYTKDLQFDVINPSSDKSLESTKNKLSIYDGLIWGGSSLNIYNDTPEIRRQIVNLFCNNLDFLLNFQYGFESPQPKICYFPHLNFPQQLIVFSFK